MLRVRTITFTYDDHDRLTTTVAVENDAGPSVIIDATPVDAAEDLEIPDVLNRLRAASLAMARHRLGDR